MRFISVGLFILALFFLIAEPAAFASPIATVVRPDCVIAAPYDGEGAADYVAPTAGDGQGPPADLDPPLEWDVGQVVLPIQVDLGARHGRTLAPGLIEEAYVGLVTVDDGSLLFNGRPLADSVVVLQPCR
ncbi:MAG: hypothetical protein D6782_12655 [Alphaproteobacteria bacterium]|nr:MAG: hypothetical protein D6782_12655 [Alphaproteobacteria bacterium]